MDLEKQMFKRRETEHRNMRENSQFSPWKEVTSGVLLPHVEDTHALQLILKITRERDQPEK